MTRILAVTLGVLAVTAIEANAQTTVQVDSMATGGFGGFSGNTSPGGDDYVLGWTFTAPGQSISLSATGTINLSNGLANNGPDGIAIPVSSPTVQTTTFTPLEQQLVEAGH